MLGTCSMLSSLMRWAILVSLARHFYPQDSLIRTGAIEVNLSQTATRNDENGALTGSGSRAWRALPRRPWRSRSWRCPTSPSSLPAGRGKLTTRPSVRHLAFDIIFGFIQSRPHATADRSRVFCIDPGCFADGGAPRHAIIDTNPRYNGWDCEGISVSCDHGFINMSQGGPAPRHTHGRAQRTIIAT
jgi:hypothetical protein